MSSIYKIGDLEIDLQIVTNCYLSGAEPDEVAFILGVDANVWKKLVKSDRNILDAVMRGGAVANGSVVAALHKTCVGYSARQSKVVSTAAGPMVVEYTQYVGPDANACFRWLERRLPGVWGPNAGASEDKGKGDEAKADMVRDEIARKYDSLNAAQRTQSLFDVAVAGSA